jgi:pyruvate dehydrogenase E1 component beta subunit
MNTSMTYRDALNLAMATEMEADPSVFIMGLDVPDHKRIFGSTRGLVEKFGLRRCAGTPLSEDAMMGVALGAAISGLRPIFVHIRTDFMLLTMNQIANMVSCLRYMGGGKHRVPLVIRAVIGRGWGQSAQHSKSLHSFYAHIPGLKVVMPSRAQDAYSLLRTAIRDENPVICLEHRWLYDVEGPVDTERQVPIGQPNRIREGESLTVVCTSWMNVEALKAAQVLEKRGVDLEVIDVRSIAPLDLQEVLDSVSKTGICIVADYDWVPCGFSSEIASQISYHCHGKLKMPVERLGFAHVHCPSTRSLENLYYPSAVTLIQTAEKMLGLTPTDLTGEEFFSYENNFRGPF